MSDETTLLPCPICGSDKAPEISDVGECEECVRFDDCERRGENNTCEGCDEWERPMFVVCNYNMSRCGTSGPYRKTKAEAIEAWNTRATIGGQPVRLTAEQVRGVLLLHLPHREYYSIAQTDGWQAIADALNATLGRGTCEYVIEDNMNETDGMGDVWFRCTNCGTSYDYYADEWLLKMPYCPKCGCEVER